MSGENFNSFGDDLPEKDGALTKPRPALPAGWIDDPAFIGFDAHDRHYAHQITQHLDALSADKARILLNYLDCAKGFRL